MNQQSGYGRAGGQIDGFMAFDPVVRLPVEPSMEQWRKKAGFWFIKLDFRA